MRISLARSAALLVIGMALATLPGAASPRAGGRERDRGARLTTARGGYPRLEASDAAIHGHESTAPDAAEPADVLQDVSGNQYAAPRDLVAPFVGFARPPIVDALLLPPSPVRSFHSAYRRVHAPGRAPPVP